MNKQIIELLEEIKEKLDAIIELIEEDVSAEEMDSSYERWECLDCGRLVTSEEHNCRS